MSCLPLAKDYKKAIMKYFSAKNLERNGIFPIFAAD